jgi:Membrane protein involved in the export of O-antigen and teichoic acid
MTIKQPSKWLAEHPFLRNNLIFFIGSIAAGVLNYLFYPVLGRLLSLSAFGEVQVVVSLFTQLAIFFSAIGLVTTNIAANVADTEKRNQVVSELEKIGLVGVAAASLAGFFALTWVQHFLQLSSMWPLVALIVTMIIGVPLAFGTAYLQGRHRFTEISLANILGAAAKLVLAVAFVLIGLGAFGAIAGIAMAQLVTWLLVSTQARKAGFHWTNARRALDLDLALLRPELNYAGLVLVVSLVTTLLYTGDIIVVKHFFSPELAGAYSGVAVTGRILFFLTASIGGVMFPTIKVGAATRENRRILIFSLGLNTLLGCGALAIFTAAPRQTLDLFLGARYLGLSYLLPRLGIALCLISVMNLLFLYHLALRRRGIAVIAAVGGAVTFGLFAVFHASFETIINDLIAASVIILAVMGIWCLVRRTDKIEAL